jgi:hypothetical protein
MSDNSSKTQQQRCCLGLLYYSQALQAEGQKPVCVGVSHAPTERIKLEDNKLLREQHGFKFVCVGNSLYEPPTGQGSSSNKANGQMQTLPYCEGLEVIIGTNVEAAAAEAAAATGRSGQPVPEDWGTLISTMFGGEESTVGRGVARFNKIAARNWDRMKLTANQAYSTAVKPLMDRLSGDQQQ